MVELKGSYQQYEIQWATSSYADRSIVINVFNNDLDNELSCTLSKFANQTPNWGEQLQYVVGQGWGRGPSPQ